MSQQNSQPDWALSMGAYTALFLGLMTSYTLPVIIGSLIDGLAITPAQAGLLAMVEMSTIAAVTMLLSTRVATWSWRAIALTGACIAAVAQLVSTAATDVSQLFVPRIAVGLGFGCVLAVANVVIATSKDPEATYGRACAFISLAFAILLFLLPQAAHLGQHRGVFALVALVVVISIVALYRLPIRRAGYRRPDEDGQIHWMRIAVLFVAITLLYAGLFGIYSFAERIGDSIGLPASRNGLWLSLSTVAGIFGGMVAGWMGTRFGRALPLAAGCALSGVVALVISHADTEAAFAFGLVLYGAVFVFVISYLLGASAAIDRAGRVAVATTGYVLFASGLGPWLFGLIATQKGTYSSVGWPAFWLCVLAIPLVVPLTLKLDSEQRQLA